MAATNRVYQKLVEVRKAVPYLQKNNSGHQYSYVSASQVFGAVRPELDRVGLLLVTKIVDKSVRYDEVRNKDKYGNEKVTLTLTTELDLLYTFIDVESGDTLEIPFYSQGMEIGGEKGVGKALTYATKNFFLSQFVIATDAQDPDSFQDQVAQTKPAAPVSNEQLRELEQLAEAFADLRETDVLRVWEQFGVTRDELKALKEPEVLEMKARLQSWLEKAKEVAGVTEPEKREETPRREERPSADEKPYVFVSATENESKNGDWYFTCILEDEDGDEIEVIAKGDLAFEVSQLEDDTDILAVVAKRNNFNLLKALKV